MYLGVLILSFGIFDGYSIKCLILNNSETLSDDKVWRSGVAIKALHFCLCCALIPLQILVGSLLRQPTP